GHRIGDHHLGVWQRGPERADACVRRVIQAGRADDRRALGGTEHNEEPHAESALQLPATSIGTGAPPAPPTRRLDRSRLVLSGWPSIAMNIVGTPQVIVARS